MEQINMIIIKYGFGTDDQIKLDSEDRTANRDDGFSQF